MAGSLRKRPELGADAWELRVFLGRDSRGRVRHKSRTFRGSKRAAEKELSRLVLGQDFEPEVAAEPETLTWNQTTTINDAIEGWKENGWDDLSPVTVRRYENVWKVHIEKSIGKQRIATLTPYEVERYFRKLKANGAGARPFATCAPCSTGPAGSPENGAATRCPTRSPSPELPTWRIDETPEPVRAPSARRYDSCLPKAAELDPALCGLSARDRGDRRHGEGRRARCGGPTSTGEKGTHHIDESVIASEAVAPGQVAKDTGEHPERRHRCRPL